MESQNPIEERAEIVQDVIDRLLYLTPEDVKTYKEQVSKQFKDEEHQGLVDSVSILTHTHTHQDI